MQPALVMCVTLLLAAPPPTPGDALQRADALADAEKPGEAEPFYLAATRSDDPFTRRQAFVRLMGVYVKSGRQDRAVKLAETYRVWLRKVRDASGEAELDVVVGDCYLGLGHHDEADRRYAAALAVGYDISTAGRLAALRGRAEVADQKKNAPAAKQRWVELEATARTAEETATRALDTTFRVRAARYLAEALHHRGETTAALGVLAPLPALHDRLGDPLGRRDTQRQRANLLAANGHYPEAAPLFEEALALHRKHAKERRMTAGDVLAEWTEAAGAAGRRDEATRLRAEAESEFKAILDKPTLVDLEAGGPLAAFVKLQLLTRSARQFRKALDLSRNAGERWSSDVLLEVRLKADRGGLELLAASYQTARTLLRKVLADLDATDPPDLRALPQVLVNLATAELAGDAPNKAAPLLDRCVDVYRRFKLPDDSVRAECEYLRGATAAQRGDYAAAMSLFRAGLALCVTVGPSAEPVRFNLLLNMALIHQEQGDTNTALAELTGAVKSLATFAEPDDLNFGLIDAVRADLYLSQAKIEPALALVPRIEEICGKHAIRGGYLFSTARHVRAIDLLAHGEAAKAEAVWADLAVLQRNEGQLLLARTLNYYGAAAEVVGRDADAAVRYQEARTFQTTRSWVAPVTRAITLWRLAVLADKGGRKAEAKKLLAEVFDIADRARLNTFGEAGQRAQFFAQFREQFELLAGWHARDGEGDALLEVIAKSRSRTLLDQILAAGVDPRDNLAGPERDKLLAREVGARRTVSRLRAKAQLLPAGQSDDPVVIQSLKDLESAQQVYASVWLEIVNADPVTRALTSSGQPGKGGGLRIEELGARTAVLAYFIGRDESFAVLRPGGAARAEIFRLALPTVVSEGIGDVPAASAEVASGLRGLALRPSTPQPDRPPPLGGPAVALTDAAAARLIDHYLRMIADPGFNPARGMSLAPREPKRAPTHAPAEMLGDVLIPPPLRDRLRAIAPDRLVVVPDGPLHKIPLESLTLSGGPGVRYGLDELPPIVYTPSLGVLTVVMDRPRRAVTDPSLLTVGDPTYSTDLATRGVSTVGNTPGRNLPRLPFTRVESKRVREFFPPDRVTVLEGGAATEKNVTTEIPGKQFVHLAAHGFADKRFGNLFAAIALAPPPVGEDAPENDGYLTLHEIHRLKLAKCELTVLSACVTNVGPQRPLEAGVTLAGAFLCAGSRRVLATCWSVDDRATAELMGEFFRIMRAPNGVMRPSPGALKAARIKVRSTPGWNAPFFWAPFVYLGSPN
ncbi:CHAT domain-containing protein [Fimbriiglobus ruber]|uniref:CHAT domain-containing protein n=1 Tax=Fimbriiglobus ruber TaxID=1908690 RepID=A0A225DET1_9BACT|nr:CHAT domain-containing tetratricopeptide repeat protein [Fimbriiglobus ruber]OWK39972.1 hypothetical protein FRUB_05862 [Fimbriiglobus ruber]